MKRRMVLLFILALGGVLGLALWRCTAPGINKATADRIVPGMSLKAVEELIGKPPGDYTTALIDPDAEFAILLHYVKTAPRGDHNGWRFHEWRCDTGYIEVATDENNLVVASGFVELPNPIVSRVRRWLGLDQPRVFTR